MKKIFIIVLNDQRVQIHDCHGVLDEEEVRCTLKQLTPYTDLLVRVQQLFQGRDMGISVVTDSTLSTTDKNDSQVLTIEL